MISTIIKKELMEISRDGRAIGLLGIVGLLLLMSLVTGIATESAREQDVLQAQTEDSAVFLEQGVKNPHSAAHFSRMAYKPVAPMASFDPGVSSYMGQVIWLEAHARNPAMFRAAEDAPELSRLENFSIAGVLTLILPLLVVLVGYGSIASERERGTLRQLVGAGTSIQDLLLGKFAVTAGISFVVLAVTVLFATIFSIAVLDSSEYTVTDILLRGLSLLGVYGLYIVCLTAITMLVSMLVMEAKSALLVMLGVWVIAVVGLPRLSASIAEQVYPSTDANTFWEDTSTRLRANRPDSSSSEYLAIEQEVIERALGRELREGELESIDLNSAAVRLEVSEVIDAETYNAAYADLFENYDKQKNLRRLLSVFSPTIALQHLSRSYSGTDVSAHEHFSIEAEKQRNTIVRSMNEDMMVNGAGQSFGYLAPAEFWESVPEFEYQPSSIGYAWSESSIDLLILIFWGLVATFAMFWFGSKRVTV